MLSIIKYKWLLNLYNKFTSDFGKNYLSIIFTTILIIASLIFILLPGNLIVNDDNSVKKIYFVDNISSSHKVLIERFNKLYMGKIEVVPIDLPFDKFSTNERKELLIRYLRSKSDRVDLFSVDQIWVPRFAKWSEPVVKYFNSNQRNQILSQVLSTCYLKDTLVAIPLYFDIGVMYCNNKLINKLPNSSKIKQELENFITWESFIKFGVDLKKYGNPFYLFPADNYEGLMCSFVEIMESQNEKLFDNDTVKLNTKAAQKSLQLLVDLVNKYELSPKQIGDFRETEAYNYFIKKEGVFLRGWPGFHKWYKEKIKNEDVANDYQEYPLPHFNDEKPSSIMGGWNIMISKYSSKKAESVAFIKFLISEESQKLLYENGGYLPVKKSVYDDTSFINRNKELKFYYNLLKTTVNRPFTDKYTRFSDIIAYYLNLAIENKMSVEDALNKAQKTINSDYVFIK